MKGQWWGCYRGRGLQSGSLASDSTETPRWNGLSISGDLIYQIQNADKRREEKLGQGPADMMFHLIEKSFAFTEQMPH